MLYNLFHCLKLSALKEQSVSRALGLGVQQDNKDKIKPECVLTSLLEAEVNVTQERKQL